jgi:N-acetylneuraminic acid mutarotase
MAVARDSHTATLLSSGKVLAAGGEFFNGSANQYLASAELYDPATGTWSTAGSMAATRGFGHTATLLQNGKVLVAGGGLNNGSGTQYLASAELYDPATGSWSTTGSMAAARSNHTATLLPNGKVLVAAGVNSANPVIILSSAELYDPATGTWSTTGSMATARKLHTATLLSNGKDLVAGGTTSGSDLTSAELYDPATGTWSTTGSMATARKSHTATLLSNGRILVAGGNGSSGNLATAELYDPTLGTWSTTGSMTGTRKAHTATLLSNGEVLAAGGIGGTNSDSQAGAELYDPATGTWSTTASMAVARGFHSGTMLSNGKVLVAGGLDTGSGGSLASAELYDPSAPPVVPEAPSAILLPLMGIAALGLVLMWRGRRARASG